MKIWDRRNRIAADSVEDIMIIYENEDISIDDDEEEE
jgi:hypothetical protein